MALAAPILDGAPVAGHRGWQVLVTQLVGNLVVARQLRAKAQVDVVSASQYLGHSASNSIRFFRNAPPNYRPLLIQQFREMGGTRFFVNVASAPVAIQTIEPNGLADQALRTRRAGRSG